MSKSNNKPLIIAGIIILVLGASIGAYALISKRSKKAAADAEDAGSQLNKIPSRDAKSVSGGSKAGAGQPKKIAQAAPLKGKAKRQAKRAAKKAAKQGTAPVAEQELV